MITVPVTNDELMESVRAVREEAERLYVACVEAAKSGAFLHVAYDPHVMGELPFDHAALLGQLNNINLN